jgi:hypothetical protein
VAALLALLITLAALRGGGGSSGGGGTSEQAGAPAPALGEAEPLCSWGEYRLPAGIVPQQYNLTLDASELEGSRLVEGTVAIALDVQQASRCVVLHAAGMQILEARLGGPEGEPGGGLLLLLHPPPLPLLLLLVLRA